MLLKKILFESETPEEFLYPPKLGKNLLNKILHEPDPKKQLLLAKNNLQLLGTGSGRFVFDIGEDKALKLAPVKTEQNIREWKHWKCVQGTPAEDMFVKVFDKADDFRWLIVERVVGFRTDERPIQLIFHTILNTANDTDLTEEKLGDYFGSTLYDLWTKIESQDDPPFDSFWYNTLKTAIKTCRINIGDFIADNLGYRPSTGEFVILDFGY
jgi:hypothetical protein